MVQAFSVVPGHEFVGRVLEVGGEVAAYSVGDRVGVGVLYSACRSCGHCDEGRENYCPDVQFTYGGFEANGKTPTCGGYSTKIVVDEHFVLKVPDNLDPAAAAPDEPGKPGYLQIDTLLLAAQRRNVHGSLIGGIPEAQGLLDHCGEHDIVCDVEVIRPEQINEAYRRTLAADVKYRFVIDCNQF